MFHSVVYSDLKASQIGKHCVLTAYALHHLPMTILHVLKMSSDALLIKRQTKIMEAQYLFHLMFYFVFGSSIK